MARVSLSRWGTRIAHKNRTRMVGDLLRSELSLDLDEVDALLDRVVERRQVGVRRPIRVLVGEQLAVKTDRQ